MHSSFLSRGRSALGLLACALAFLVSGCHGQGNISYYGVGWVTLTGEGGGTTPTATAPGDFASYIVNVVAISLTRSTDGLSVPALGTAETVDLTQIKNIAELWGSATIPDGTYQSATITLDYTSAVITVMVNGVATPAKVVDKNGLAVTTQQQTVTFDAANAFVVSPTYASTSAERLAIDFDLAASGYVNTSVSPPVVTVNPFLTVGVKPADTKLIRVRGPLINSNISVGTYTVYIRPFYDEASNLGSLSLFSTPTTIYTINGKPYTGTDGITALSLLSAGITETAAYTTFVPDLNPANKAPAGTFYPVYVVAGSTLEDNYTEGITGEVIARTGDTVTLRGSTLILNTADTSYFCAAGLAVPCDANDVPVLLGPGTLVTADGTTLSGLTANDIAVGQHIQARGLYNVSSADEVESLDARGSSTNTGSVRLLQTELWGTLVSSGAGSLTMNLSTIDGWPVSIFNFAGNGATAAQNPVATAFDVALGTLAVPAGTAAGDPVWVNGLAAPFGAAPPDFTAYAVNSEESVQLAGGSLTAAGTQSCGLGSQTCEPASLRVLYKYSTGTATPFTGLSNAGFNVDLANPELVSAVIRIGPQSIDMKSLTVNPQIVPTTLPVTTTFSPRYSLGNPTTATVTTTVTTATTSIASYSSFPAFVAEFNSVVSAADPVLQFDVRGVYNPTANTFTATSINVVL